MTTVEPVTRTRPDGGKETTYLFPDGSDLISLTPPPGFDPLVAADAQLEEFGFQTRPSDSEDLREWTEVMSAYSWEASSEPPTDPIQIRPRTASLEGKYATLYYIWGAYIAGTVAVQSKKYVAVKGTFTVPSSAATCSSWDGIGIWIGLGGTSWDRANSLVQQGIACGNTKIGSGSAWRPFTEFASTEDPLAFCGYGSWTFPAGHRVYQNMSFQTSGNRAYFYMQDLNTGTTHSCSLPGPSGWAWDLNTAEWAIEAPFGHALNFTSVPWTNVRAQLASNSTWVTLGSQPNTKMILGKPGNYCVAPGAIGSGGTTFTTYWHQTTCTVPPSPVWG